MDAMPSSAPCETLRKLSTLSPQVLQDTGRTPHIPLRGSQILHREVINEVTSDGVKGCFLGPIPAINFLERFLPRTSDRIQLDCPLQYRHTTSKRALHHTFVEQVRSLLPTLFSRVEYNATDKVYGISPGVGFYPKGSNARPGSDFAEMALFGEIKPNDSDDPFLDEGGSGKYPFEAQSGFVLRGQLAACAAAVMGLQFRTHVFSFVIFGRYARILRWDASGIAVTERFNYSTSNTLASFFRRFDNASNVERGYDPTVTRIPSNWPTQHAPPAALCRLQEADEYYYDGEKPERRLRRHRYFALVKIPDRNDPSQEADFLISCPPIHRIQSPVGRSTRPMLAYDLVHKSIVFAKQYWRAVGKEFKKEGDVYRTLFDQGVRNLPAFGRGNDVRGLTSLTQDLQASHPSWSRSIPSLPAYRMYRMSLDTVGEPLTQFQTTEELLRVVTDAMICHDDAFFKAHILHCDISVGNIMINPQTRGGMLIDWDLCASAVPGTFHSNDTERTGTWEFMSISLLESPITPHSIVDDRESLLHLLTWTLLLYSPHNRTEELPYILEIFSEAHPMGPHRPPKGGTRKLGFLARGDFAKKFIFQHGQTIPELITILQRHFFENRYYHRNYDTTDQMQQREAKIAKEGWLVGILQEALGRGPWPSSTPAVRNDHPDIPDRKRRACEAELDDDERFAKSRKLSRTGSAASHSLPRDLRKLPPLPPSATIHDELKSARRRKM